VLKRSWKWHYLYCSLGLALSLLAQFRWKAKKAFESLGIAIVSDYFLRKGSTNPKEKP
jgi:hypothetical protein